MSHLKSLGGFKNVRSDYDWEGFKLELDETQFDWGTVYEIEVETVSYGSPLQYSAVSLEGVSPLASYQLLFYDFRNLQRALSGAAGRIQVDVLC